MLFCIVWSFCHGLFILKILSLKSKIYQLFKKTVHEGRDVCGPIQMLFIICSDSKLNPLCIDTHTWILLSRNGGFLLSGLLLLTSENSQALCLQLLEVHYLNSTFTVFLRRCSFSNARALATVCCGCYVTVVSSFLVCTLLSHNRLNSLPLSSAWGKRATLVIQKV